MLMNSKNSPYFLIYVIILLSLIVSGYLLFNHFAISMGKPLEYDLCSTVFGKACDAAVFSGSSMFMKIPVGGWGIIYLVVVGCLIIMSQIFYNKAKNELLQIAFWFSVIGIGLSLFYMVIMLLNPILLCPICLIFHILNFIFFFLIKKLTGMSFSELYRALFKALGIIFLGKPATKTFVNWKWLTIILPLVLGLSIYQWVFMQGLNIMNEKLANYDPLIEIEKFEARKIWDIHISESDLVLGPKDAPVSLVVYSDFECSLCEMFATNFKELIAYNRGRLKIIFKYFPLSSSCNPIATYDLHPLACHAAVAAEAAHKQGKFWEYHDLLFKNGIGDNDAVFFELAQSIGLNMEQFKSDYESVEIQNNITSDINEGIQLGIEGTPTAFLNGRKLSDLSAKNINYLVKFSAH